MPENKLEHKGRHMVKTFGSRTSYVKENTIYQKLRKKKLTPELVASYDGVIEYTRIEGPTLAEELLKIDKFPQEKEKFFAMFFEWYKKYRDITHLAIGDMDFNDFIIEDEKLIGIDFEHCKPGYAEDDFARLAVILSLKNDAYASYNLESAKLFIDMAKKEFPIDSRLLYQGFQKNIPLVEKELGVNALPEGDEYIICSNCCKTVPVKGVGDVTGDQVGSLKWLADQMAEDSQVWSLLLPADPVQNQDKLVRRVLSVMKGNSNAVLAKGPSGEAAYDPRKKTITMPVLLKTEEGVAALKEADAAGYTDPILAVKKYMRAV